MTHRRYCRSSGPSWIPILAGGMAVGAMAIIAVLMVLQLGVRW